MHTSKSVKTFSERKGDVGMTVPKLCKLSVGMVVYGEAVLLVKVNMKGTSTDAAKQ